MASTEASSSPTEMPELGAVDMKLEVVTPPVIVTGQSAFTRALDGGWTPISSVVTPSARSR